MTHQYELMVILDPEIDERTVAPSLDKFLKVITQRWWNDRQGRHLGHVAVSPTRSRRRPKASTPSSTSPRPAPPPGARPPAEAQRSRHAHQGAARRRGDRSGRRCDRSAPRRRPPARLPLRPRLRAGRVVPMAGETIITVVGNLTADPELRYTQNGLRGRELHHRVHAAQLRPRDERVEGRRSTVPPRERVA